MSDHLLHISIDNGTPRYRIECVDPATCTSVLLDEDEDRAKALALSEMSHDECVRLAVTTDADEQEDILRDVFDAVSDHPWPWVPAEPKRCWAVHMMEFAGECGTFEHFSTKGEINGPIKVRVWSDWNVGLIDEPILCVEVES